MKMTIAERTKIAQAAWKMMAVRKRTIKMVDNKEGGSMEDDN